MNITDKPRFWRVGRKVPVNVYDEFNRPVCQCHLATDALLIVTAVNAMKQGIYKEVKDEQV